MRPASPIVLVATLLAIFVAVAGFIADFDNAPTPFSTRHGAAADTSDADNSRGVPVAVAAREEVSALADQLRQLGMRRLAVCNSGTLAGVGSAGAEVDAARAKAPIAILRCGESSRQLEAAAGAVAATGVQAVIFVGTTAEAVTFIKALRAMDNFAMVVVNAPVDPKALVRALPPAARTWLAVGQSVPYAASGARAPERVSVRLGVLAGNGAILR